jgi:circadian clock protein KaiC
MMKKRVGGHEDTIRVLRISPDGIAVGDPLDRFRGVLTGVPVLTRRRRKKRREA